MATPAEEGMAAARADNRNALSARERNKHTRQQMTNVLADPLDALAARIQDAARACQTGNTAQAIGCLHEQADQLLEIENILRQALKLFGEPL